MEPVLQLALDFVNLEQALRAAREAAAGAVDWLEAGTPLIKSEGLDAVRALRREFPNMSPLHCPGTWCPPDLGPWMSNDECGAVNTTMFDQFLLPEMIDLAETFGGIGMHCCAAAEHQFASFNKIPNLYGLNRVQATQGYFPILDHFAGPGSPTHVLAWIDDETIAALLEQAPAGTRFIVQNTLDDVDEAKAWLDKMRSLPPI